ncbi:MAG: hypothetical protein ACI8P3_000390 [Saprospiraceae bacterium]|jgi:hypothetical protein
MKKFPTLFLTLIICLSSCTSLKNMALEPTSLETITAVKGVLDSSAFRAINALQKLNKEGLDGFIPPEFQSVLATLKTLGLEKEMDAINLKIGQVSKIMAEESTGIMADAIKEVKFKDAVGIVLGEPNAAANALKNGMYAAVKKRYSSKLEAELGKTEALKYWPMAAGAYNLFAKNKVDSSLSDFMAERAVDALFLTMGKEESNIRKDPNQLEKAVVSKVFDYYNKKKGKG